MFLKALLAFLVLPSVVAGLVPFLLGAWETPTEAGSPPAGLPVLGVGVAVVLWCGRDFYVIGKGTLAPWSPPEHLVVVGLYRVSRNPMYVGVVLAVLGQAVVRGTLTLYAYAVFLALAFHLRVVLDEEPFLAERHGDAWTAYAARVPRWGLPGRRRGAPK